MQKYLVPTEFLDFDTTEVKNFVRRYQKDEMTDLEKAVSLYYAVRDEIPYSPYGIDLSPYGMKASTLIKKGKGFCIPKAVLFAATARTVGIPSRLGFADVRNHLSTERFRKLMQSNLYLYHGFAEVYLEGKWVKATPAFNKSLCEKFGVVPLEFNGKEDSLFQEYNQKGHKFMEYVQDRGVFEDLPLQEIKKAFYDHYPLLMEYVFQNQDFEAEAQKERG